MWYFVFAFFFFTEHDVVKIHSFCSMYQHEISFKWMYIRVLQKNRNDRQISMCMYMSIQEIYYEKLAHVIMEATKSHDLPSAS